VIIAERRLHRVQLVALRNPLDGGDIGAVGLPDQYGAGFNRPPVDVDDTGAALAGVAADMGTGQIQMIAQEMDEEVLSSISAETALPLIFSSTLDIPQLPAFLFQRPCPNQRLRAKATEAVANLPLE
jgi:hypothetical protein